ncbi:MAG: Mut7-C RNAse domain-containing protein [Thermoplasmata archaeon]|nr:Mut7-C RNAse domain-containing protein [Thermoplasmata archaeon]
MTAPRWLVDEMLGRLARSLRVLGHDTAYVSGLADADIAERARAESRTLVTRDRALALHVPGSLLLTSGAWDEQLLQLRRARPNVSWKPRFDRCTICNGELLPAPSPAGRPIPGGPTLPPGVLDGREPLFRCPDCGHLYWVGSHTRQMRESFSRVFVDPVAP